MNKLVVTLMASGITIGVTNLSAMLIEYFEDMASNPEKKKKLLKTKIGLLSACTVADFIAGFCSAKGSCGFASVFNSIVGCITAYHLFNIIEEGVENGELQI